MNISRMKKLIGVLNECTFNFLNCDYPPLSIIGGGFDPRHMAKTHIQLVSFTCSMLAEMHVPALLTAHCIQYTYCALSCMLYFPIIWNILQDIEQVKWMTMQCFHLSVLYSFHIFIVFPSLQFVFYFYYFISSCVSHIDNEESVCVWLTCVLFIHASTFFSWTNVKWCGFWKEHLKIWFFSLFLPFSD